MNENEMRKEFSDPCDPTQCDPLPPSGAESDCEEKEPSDEVSEAITLSNEGEAEESPDTSADGSPKASSNDLEIPANSDSDPDLDPAAVVEANPEEQLRQLRDELTRLRQAISQQDAILSRLGEECQEFQTLYPDTPISSLPDNVWSDVKQGIPLAAAYALAERRRAYTESLAAATNQKNGQRSSGAMKSTESDYFSPNEVRAMSQAEVRANYQKIMRSMQKWR